MTAQFRLTSRAIADLDEIADYTMEEWGRRRRGTTCDP
jgi:plasmid stabilization system protein ParE